MTACAIARDCDGVVNVAGTEVWTIREIAECLASALGVAPSFKTNALPYDGDLVADTTRLEKLLGRHHHPISDGLRAVGQAFLPRGQAPED